MDKRRSVIIPVWYKVSKADVLGLSTFLADIPAIVSTDVLEIADRIRFAVGMGEQAKRSLNPVAKQLQDFQESAAVYERYQKFCSGSEGIQAVSDEWDKFGEIARRALLNQNEARFQVFSGTRRGGAIRVVQVQGVPFRRPPNMELRELALRFELDSLVLGITDTKCTCSVLFVPPDSFPTRLHDIAAEMFFVPYCTAEGVPIWRKEGGTSVITTQGLVEVGLIRFLEIAAKVLNGESVTWRASSYHSSKGPK